ncbi:MAG: 2-hydroxyacid dehydrogenase [Planctomycetota bacterium]|jgi:D-3-phosphoglycerate dehydrogenase
MQPNILVTANFGLCLEGLDVLRDAGQLTYLESPPREQALPHLEDVDAYLGSPDIKVDAEFLAHAPRLKVVCTASTGTDHIDIPALEARGITLFSLKHEQELLRTFTSVAEMTWGLLLSCLRRIPYQFDRIKGGEMRWWADGTPMPRQLHGKTLGIFGVGRLGTMVAEYGQAFGMRVLGCDLKTLAMPNVEQVDLETLVRESDIFSIHVHLDEATHHIIDAAMIAKMKPGVVLLNTARGDIVVEDDLIDALESGHVAAAGLDVFHNEWDPDLAAHRLFAYARTHHNLIITPHIAGASIESIAGARVFMAEKLAAFLVEEVPAGGVA